MTKTILTLDELVKFCQENKIKSFSSSKYGKRLAVKVPCVFEIDNDDAHRGMLGLKFKLFHTLLNRNGSFVSEESADDAMLTIPYRPILAAIHQLDDGTWDFEAHEMEEVENEEGEKEIRYIESQVGCLSSEPAWKEYDEELDKTFICCKGYIPRDYTKAAEIIERKNGTKNSVELYIDEMSYNSKAKYLDLKKFYVNGTTLLGSKADGTEIQEGMLGSRADIEDFSEENNSVRFEQNEQLIKAIETLNETLSHFNINDSLGKEVKEVKKEDIKETEELEQITLFDLTDGADPTDDPTGDTTGEVTEPTEPTEPVTEPAEPTIETPASGETNGSGSSNDEPTFNPAITDDGADEGMEIAGIKKVQYTVSHNGNTKEFGLGVSAKLEAVYQLVSATYEEADNEWYRCELFEEDGYIEMYGMFTGRCYRQNYVENDGEFSFTGERIEIFQMFVTAEEKEALGKMQMHYDEMSEKLRKYEEEPEKMQILNSEDYSKVFSTEEYTELLKQESHFDMSIDEVKAKADSILLDYAKHSNFNLLSENESQAKFVQIPVIQKKLGRYGTLFAQNSEIKSE